MRAAACALLLAVGGCGGPEPEPRFAATCGFDESQARIACSIKNHGNKASRACFRARLQPETGEPIITRRVCTAVLGPGQSAQVTPPVERVRNVEPTDLSPRCARRGRVDVQGGMSSRRAESPRTSRRGLAR